MTTNTEQLLGRIEGLRTLALMIDGEPVCEVRKIYIDGFNVLARMVAEHYNPQEEVTHLEEVTPEPPAPKKRGRKKKEETSADQDRSSEQPTTSAAQAPLPPPPPEVEINPPFPPGESQDSELDPNPAPAPVDHALVFDDDCLISDYPRVMDLHLVTDEWIENSGISPVVLANSCATQGDHPFYKGVPSFISYLPPDRWAFYMAGLFDTTENILDLIDAQRLDECEHSGGPNMDFVISVIDPETRLPREPQTLPDDPDTINELRTGGAMRFVEALGEGAENGKALLRFMTRFGIHKELMGDLEEILAMHNDPDERNPDVRF